MGKETKIGLGVIAALLIVLVVVLTLRLTGPRGEAAASPEPSAESSAKAAVKAKAAPAPKPVAIKVVAKKPAFPAGKPKGFQMSKPQYGNKKATANSNTSDKIPLPLQLPVPSGDEPRQSAGWANIGSQSSPAQVQSGSSMFVLDPPDPPRSGAGSAANRQQYPSAQQYNRQRPSAGIRTPGNRPRAAQPVYKSVSTTRGAVKPRNYGGYQRSYGGQYAVTPPPATPRSITGGPRADGTYEIQPNDNYWQISKSIYGSGAYFKALVEHNRKDHPVGDRLRVGDVISTPALAELVDGYPDFCPSPRRRETLEKRARVVEVSAQYGGGSTYAVQDGDTLYDIARYELGDASRWVEIYELNRHVIQGDFDYLTSGMKLVMPREATDSITQRPALYQPPSRNTLRR